MCVRNFSVKDIYQDLSELAFYLMENDAARIYKGIEQMRLTVNEIERGQWINDQRDDVAIRLIITEIKTHLQYLSIEYGKGA